VKEFEAIGLWHLPGDPSNEVAGTLHFSDEEGLRLSLTGTFREAPGFPSSQPGKKYPIVYGVVNESPFGTLFTLLDCFETASTHRIPAGLTTQRIRANRAYVGRCFIGEDIRFDAMCISFTHLYDWLNKTGMKTEYHHRSQDKPDVTLEYHAPDDVCFPLAGKPATIAVRCSTSESVFGQFSLTENAAIDVGSLGHLDLQDLGKRYARPLQNFFTLAADTPVAIEEEILFSDQIKESESDDSVPIHVLGKPIFRPKAGSERRYAHDMLFTYHDVEASLGDLLNRWLGFTTEFAPFCNVFFGSLYAPGAYVQTRFLSAVEAMILFLGQSRSPNEEVRRATEAARGRLVEPFSGKRKEWAELAFPTEAEVDFAWSLAAALKEQAEIMEPLVHSDPEGFVDAIVATQRYYVRFDAAYEARALRGLELHWATEKLNVLLKACILDRLGISRDQISKLFVRNAQYRYLKGIG
jgi:hypothetical protein